MRVLVVSSYPPRHCGIGTYAAAQVARLREDGHEVVVLSPPDGDGDASRSFFGGAAFRHAATIGRRFDRIVLHFEPGLYFRPRTPALHVLTAASLLWLVVLRRPRVVIVVHEATEPPSRVRPDYRLLGLAFARARLLFHTETERITLERAYRIRTDATLIPHADSVTLHAPLPRAEARRRLGLEADGPVFVCAGFLHADKGFDHAVEAFAIAGSPGNLYVVGSIRTSTPETVEYVRSLRELCERTERVALIERFVPDDEFDEWIAAADRVIFPYQRAWSSGALARAQRLATPALVSDVGGLAEQAGPNDVVFSSEQALARLFALPPAADAATARLELRAAGLAEPPPEETRQRGAIFGVRLHDLRSEDLLRRTCAAFLEGERTFRIFTPNPEILLRAKDDASFADVLNSADLALPDGTGVALVESLRVRKRVRRWPGVEIAALLVELAAERRASVVFLGGSDGVGERAAQLWRVRFPGLRVDVVGADVEVGEDGVARSADRDAELVERIRNLAPAIVLVGLGAPKQERWIARHADALPSVRIAMGVGGAFDMWAGRLRRAPQIIHSVGMEWAWRLALEPGRLPRIVRATFVFPFRALTGHPR